MPHCVSMESQQPRFTVSIGNAREEIELCVKSAKMLAQCICQMCSCGRHRCAKPKDGTWAKRKDATDCKSCTEYQSVYIPRPLEKRITLRPKREDGLENLGYGEDRSKMMCKTNYTEDFKVHEVSQRQCPPKTEYEAPCECMDLVTIYNQDYYKKASGRAALIKPKSEYNRPGGNFTTNTVNQLTYIPYSNNEMAQCRSLPMKLPGELVNDSTSKFDAISTVQADYKQHKDTTRVQPIRPKQNNTKDSSKFDDMTSYKQDFKPKTPVARTQCKKNEYRPTQQKFEGLTTFMADFKPHPGQRRQPCFKPANRGPTFVGSKTPFDGCTIQRMAYQPWSAPKPPKPEWGQRKPYEKPNQKMDFTTMYTNDFERIKDAVRVQAIIPISEDHPLRNRGPMDSSSHYKENFIEWKDVCRPASFKKVHEYKEPVEKFDCASIQRSHYKGEYAPRAVICRPPVQKSSDNPKPMDHLTICKDTFKGQQPKVCVVQDFVKDCSTDILKSSKYDHIQNKKGHQFYRKTDKPAPEQVPKPVSKEE
ncbi:stabilizer of axonemal microtubules 1-like [Tubulanus polymorphus]|uniref:stabilizer of axonemal microtubules 1-like n=1 Tax=Tubulanus polymorphus TaxID=672921 RepID=UPI003DA55319